LVVAAGDIASVRKRFGNVDVIRGVSSRIDDKVVNDLEPHNRDTAMVFQSHALNQNRMRGMMGSAHAQSRGVSAVGLPCASTRRFDGR